MRKQSNSFQFQVVIPFSETVKTSQILKKNEAPQKTSNKSLTNADWAEENLARTYRTSLSQLRLSFCSSFHSYRESIGLTSSPLCHFCGEEPHWPTPSSIFSLVPPVPHSWPKNTHGNDRTWRRNSSLASLSFRARIFRRRTVRHKKKCLFRLDQVKLG